MGIELSLNSRGVHHMELYYLAQHRFLRFGGAAGLAIRENGRPLDAA